MTKALASVALWHIVKLLWRFDGYNRPADPVDLIDILVVAGGLKVGEEDSQRFLCSSVNGIMQISYSVPLSVKVFNNFITVSGVVESFDDYIVGSFGWKVRCFLFWATSWRRRAE